MRCKIPVEIIELEKKNYHLLVSSLFADGSTGLWVIDTGASKTVFDKNLMEHVKKIDGATEDLHSANVDSGPLQTSLACLHPFALGKLMVVDQKVALLDMNNINEVYSKSAGIKICGLLGSDFLVKYKAVVDYKKRHLVLKP